jgi:ferredoxin/menaquinone-dependent protoporphyrinogen IX oxidase
MKIGIAVFSGTGNTAYVTQLLARELEQNGATVDIYKIDSSSRDNRKGAVLAAAFNPAGYDLIGIGHPVLGFGSTPLVVRFAESLPSGDRKVFVFKSAADNHKINNSASEDIIKILEAKGYQVVHDFLYVMPCNWIFSYSRSFNLQITDKAQEKAVQHASEILSGSRSFMPVYGWWRKTARFFHYLESNYGRKQFGNSLYVTKDCDHCGRCVKNCPVGNITEENQTIRFGEECLWCMRCIYNCHKKAVHSRGMDWCAIKGGYSLKDYIGATDADRTFITNATRGYWKHFYEYFK